MVDKHLHSSFRSTMLAATTATITGLGFVAFFYYTTQIMSVRNSSPWANDPYDFVMSYAIIIMPILLVLLWVRMLQYRRSHEVTLPVLLLMLRTSSFINGLVTVVLITDTLALLHSIYLSDTWTLNLVLVLLTLALVCVVSLSFLIKAVYEFQPITRGKMLVWSDHADAMEDAFLILPFTKTTKAEFQHFLSKNKLSPRRHILWYGIIVSALFGVALSTWHGIIEGSWVQLWPAVLFATLGGLALFIALYLGYRFLYLIKNN